MFAEVYVVQKLKQVREHYDLAKKSWSNECFPFGRSYRILETLDSKYEQKMYKRTKVEKLKSKTNVL